VILVKISVTVPAIVARRLQQRLTAVTVLTKIVMARPTVMTQTAIQIPPAAVEQRNRHAPRTANAARTGAVTKECACNTCFLKLQTLKNTEAGFGFKQPRLFSILSQFYFAAKAYFESSLLLK